MKSPVIQAALLQIRVAGAAIAQQVTAIDYSSEEGWEPAQTIMDKLKIIKHRVEEIEELAS